MSNVNELYFAKLPNRIFYSAIEKESSILQLVESDKVILIFDFLYTNTNRKEIVRFALEDMIEECGFTVNNRKGRINDNFRYILSKLQEYNFITCMFKEEIINPSTIEINKTYTCTLNIDFSQEFIQLFEHEKEKILNQTIEKVDNLKLLTFYCYLKSRMWKRAKDGDLMRDGGKTEACYPTYTTIAKDINVTKGSIKKYIDILVELNLIRVGNAGLWHHKGDETKTVRESANTYVLYKEGWERELQESIKQYKDLFSDTKVFIGSKEYKNNDRQLNGKKGYLKKLINQGKATEEDIQEYEKISGIIATKNGKNDIKFSIQSLLDKNEGTLLSQIYDDQGKLSLYKKYVKLEEKLGLVNEQGDLLVDWGCYKHTMVNYEEDKHLY